MTWTRGFPLAVALLAGCTTAVSRPALPERRSRSAQNLPRARVDHDHGAVDLEDRSRNGKLLEARDRV